MKTPRSMSFAQLAEFVSKRMRMSHIYQPLLIKALVDSKGVRNPTWSEDGGRDVRGRVTEK